ncbi:NTP pyrophosphohydrolase [Magnetospirillum fulvum MGU-K5]|uniref:8-oxo-dGTP diphosphatase n=1 Tax=Magnetospirillum fulvum MGU-K5 TaxID=1316936 RepID=S9TXP2_MAGFU|nr:bifunctional GNAT family N-acetyltransferase/(deoxy)nucleoside triphosphate pyrophosphohydrolase [Magnetospirillum fulvum]EPY03090.1 NTP pyrophosphohydrolase [Magnetospirillum fulvum MGU-K5]
MTTEAGCRQAGSIWAGHRLRTARLVLRLPTPADAASLPPLLDDWEVVRLTARIPHPYGVDDAAAFIAEQEQRRQSGQGVALLLERTIDGVVIGCVGFGLDAEGNPELGYWLGRAYWGQGYIVEAVRRLIRHLFETLGYASVWAQVHPDNAASKRVLAKLGFSLDGCVTCTLPARGESVVSPRFALTRTDWAAAHAARPHLLVVAAALVDGDGRVLMTTRPPGKTMAGLWEFPGGKVAPGETPEQALVRELEEELGLDVTESCLAPVGFASHDYDTFHLLMPLYVVRVWQGTPTPREGQSLRWVRAARLADLPMPPADIPLVAVLREWV